MNDDNNEIQNEMLKNVTLKWVKLDPKNPTDNFEGTKKIWEVQICVPQARTAEIAKYRKVREATRGDPSVVCINLSKNAFKADGSDAKVVRVVDQNKLALDPNVVGNGSTANVIVMRKPYEIKHPKSGKVTKSGISTMLIAVQVTKLLKYEPKSSMDFDTVGEYDDPTTANQDDDIDF
jgi:hypothetical protein